LFGVDFHKNLIDEKEGFRYPDDQSRIDYSEQSLKFKRLV
jgi:hypothetical protein